jgi:Tfp pilus assembly protein PilO
MKEFRKLFRQYHGLALSILMILGVAVGCVVGLYPAVTKIVEMQSDISALRTANTALTTKATVLEGLDEETFNQYLKELAYAVPTDKSISTLFTTIDGLSALTGVTLSDFTLTKPGSIATESAKRLTNEEKKVGTSFLPFTLTVTGTYEQIHKFMEMAIGVRRFFRIRFFNINFSKTESISAQMGMDAYYAPLPTNLGTTSHAVEQLDESDEKIITKVANLPLLGIEPALPGNVGDGSVQVGPPRDDPFEL